MANNLIERVGRIISSNLNSLIETLENSDPETIIALATAEIDDALEEIRTELGRLAAARHLASMQLQEEKLKHSEFDHKIKTALMKDDEETASEVIEKQMDIESQLPILKITISQYTEQEKKLEGCLKALASKKRQLKDELNRLGDFSDKDSDIKQIYTSANIETRLVTKVEKANLAFDRVMERQYSLMAQTEEELKTFEQIEELENMALKTKIQERLAAIKRRIKKDD